MPGPDSSEWIEYSAWIRSLWGRGPLRSRHFHKIPVRVSKMNAVAGAQLTLQLLTILKKYQKQNHVEGSWGNIFPISWVSSKVRLVKIIIVSSVATILPSALFY